MFSPHASFLFRPSTHMAETITAISDIEGVVARLAKAKESLTVENIRALSLNDTRKLCSLLEVKEESGNGCQTAMKIKLCGKLGLDWDAGGNGDPLQDENKETSQPATPAPVIPPELLARLDQIGNMQSQIEALAKSVLALAPSKQQAPDPLDGSETSLVDALAASLGSQTKRTPKTSLGYALPASVEDEDDLMDPASKEEAKNEETTQQLGPAIVKNLKKCFPTLMAWATNVVWRYYRNKREALTLAYALDRALAHHVPANTDYMEILLRRLSAVHMADQHANDWSVAEEFEVVPTTDMPLLPPGVVLQARRNARNKQLLHQQKGKAVVGGKTDN